MITIISPSGSGKTHNIGAMPAGSLDLDYYPEAAGIYHWLGETYGERWWTKSDAKAAGAVLFRRLHTKMQRELAVHLLVFTAEKAFADRKSLFVIPDATTLTRQQAERFTRTGRQPAFDIWTNADIVRGYTICAQSLGCPILESFQGLAPYLKGLR